jgi:hypothetical protein
MRMNLFHFLPVAASLALKPLNILGLEPPSSFAWDHRLSVWGVVPSMTELTSMSGLITISPEGGS